MTSQLARYRNGSSSMALKPQQITRDASRPGSEKQPRYLWLDGELVASDRATVHILNPTLHFGAGVFEDIRCYETQRGPAAFRLADHLAHFLLSIRILGVVALPHTVETLRDAICRLVMANGLNECAIRATLYFEGPLDLNLDAYRPVIGIAAWKSEHFIGLAAKEIGVRMMVASVVQTHPNTNMSRSMISGQYVNSIMAKTMAVRAGFDEAIMLDHAGYVTECTTDTLFLVRDGVIYASPRATSLEGIAHDTVVTLATDAGYRFVEERISRDQLYFADEVFVCGTAANVIPVREIDYRQIGDGLAGPTTRNVQRLLFDTIHGKTRRSAMWLDYLIVEPVV